MTNTVSPLSGCVPMTPGTACTPGRAFVALGVAAGNAKLTFADGSTMTVPILVGHQQFNYAIKQVDLSISLPATGTFYCLY